MSPHYNQGAPSCEKPPPGPPFLRTGKPGCGGGRVFISQRNLHQPPESARGYGTLAAPPPLRRLEQVVALVWQKPVGKPHHHHHFTRCRDFCPQNFRGREIAPMAHGVCLPFGKAGIKPVTLPDKPESGSVAWTAVDGAHIQKINTRPLPPICGRKETCHLSHTNMPKMTKHGMGQLIQFAAQLFQGWSHSHKIKWLKTIPWPWKPNTAFPDSPQCDIGSMGKRPDKATARVSDGELLTHPYPRHFRSIAQ